MVNIRGKTMQAISQLERAVSLNPQHPRALDIQHHLQQIE